MLRRLVAFAEEVVLPRTRRLLRSLKGRYAFRSHQYPNRQPLVVVSGLGAGLEYRHPGMSSVVWKQAAAAEVAYLALLGAYAILLELASHSEVLVLAYYYMA